MTFETTDEQRQQAIERIKAKRAFFWHLAIYVIVNAAMVVIWALTWTDYFWPGWVMFGWGIGVASHGFAVFFGMRPISEEQIQREIQRGG